MVFAIKINFVTGTLNSIHTKMHTQTKTHTQKKEHTQTTVLTHI